jgi:adenosine deaminase
MVTINSDDPAYFGGYLNENFIAIQDALNLSYEEISTLVKNSFEASFIAKEQQAEYLKMVDDFISNNT